MKTPFVIGLLIASALVVANVAANIRTKSGLDLDADVPITASDLGFHKLVVSAELDIDEYLMIVSHDQRMPEYYHAHVSKFLPGPTTASILITNDKLWNKRAPHRVDIYSPTGHSIVEEGPGEGTLFVHSLIGGNGEAAYYIKNEEKASYLIKWKFRVVSRDFLLKLIPSFKDMPFVGAGVNLPLLKQDPFPD